VTAELLANPPGSTTILFNRSLGMVEFVDAKVNLGLQLKTTPKSKLRKKTTVVQLLEAKTRVELLSVDGAPWKRSALLAN
jgi:hypothetical protein